MSRVLAAGIAIQIVALVIAGLFEGRWGWGLLYAGIGVGALRDWIRLQCGLAPASEVADRMLAYVLFLALPAWAIVEAWPSS